MTIGISAVTLDRGRSGIAQYLFWLVRTFAANTYGHRFVLFVLEQDLPFFEPLEKIIELVRVDERYRPPGYNVFWHQVALPRLVENHGIDVLHVPTYRRLPFSQPCATVATIHDTAPFHLPGKYDWKRTLYGRYVVRWLAKRQHRIIAVSHSTADGIEKCLRVPTDRLTVIHHGVDRTRFSPGGLHLAWSAVTQRHGISGRYIVYVSRLEYPGKNHLRLLEAFEQLKASHDVPWQLVFVGSDWQGASVIHQAIQDSPARDHVHTLGFVPDEDLPDLYRAADALVFPSYYEGFGLPVLEAMACGCPVICSTGGSLPEVGGDAALYFDPNDTASIIYQLTRFLNDAGLRRHLRDAGLKRSNQFRWEETGAQTLAVYSQALATYTNARMCLQQG